MVSHLWKIVLRSFVCASNYPDSGSLNHIYQEESILRKREKRIYIIQSVNQLDRSIHQPQELHQVCYLGFVAVCERLQSKSLNPDICLETAIITSETCVSNRLQMTISHTTFQRGPCLVERLNQLYRTGRVDCDSLWRGTCPSQKVLRKWFCYTADWLLYQSWT